VLVSTTWSASSSAADPIADAHLALIERWKNDGAMVIAGAIGEFRRRPAPARA